MLWGSDKAAFASFAKNLSQLKAPPPETMGRTSQATELGRRVVLLQPPKFKRGTHFKMLSAHRTKGHLTAAGFTSGQCFVALAVRRQRGCSC